MVNDFVNENGKGTTLESKVFENSDKKLNFRCRCGNPFTTTFYHFKSRNKRQCNECSNIIKYNSENAKQIFKDNDLEPLFNEFKNVKQKLTAINRDGYKIVTTLDRLVNSNKIPKPFSKTNPYTIENINIFILKMTLGYKLLSVIYIHNKEKLEWECDKGHKFKMSWSDFNSGSRCLKCFGNYRRTNNEFKEEVYNLVGKEYTFLDEFKGVDIKINVSHNTCGNIYEVTPYKFINRGQRCPECDKYRQKTNGDFVKEVYDLVGNEYIFLEEYKKAIDKILVRHNECGNEYLVTPHSFLNHNSRCPKCNESKGEKEIESILNKLKMIYKYQYRFNDCRNILPLPFDFAVLDDNGKVLFLIEYDGRQHYEAIEYFGGEKTLKETQKRDKIKNNYCLLNNIPLLRIPHWDYKNIDNILNTFLNKVFLLC